MVGVEGGGIGVVGWRVVGCCSVEENDKEMSSEMGW